MLDGPYPFRTLALEEAMNPCGCKLAVAILFIELSHRHSWREWNNSYPRRYGVGILVIKGCPMTELTNERVAEALGWMLCERGDDGTRFWRKMPSWTDYYGPLPDWLHSNELAVRDVLPVLEVMFGTLCITSEAKPNQERLYTLTNTNESLEYGEWPTLSEALCAALVNGKE
jgi:hypothetical protein